MRHKPFTEDEKNFIRENFDCMTLHQIASALGRSHGGVKSRAMSLGLRRNNRFLWTEEKLEILRAIYPNNSSKEVAGRLNHTEIGVSHKAHQLGIKKDETYLKQLKKEIGENLQKNGCETRFSKGHKPWSAGKKIGSRGRSKETQFKIGQKPPNAKKIGDITKPCCYWKIKIAEPNVWQFLHIYLWENAYGKVPKGLCIVFKDKDADNCILENLECLTRGQLLKKHSVHTLPEQLKQTIYTLGHLKRTIKRRFKNAEK